MYPNVSFSIFLNETMTDIEVTEVLTDISKSPCTCFKDEYKNHTVLIKGDRAASIIGKIVTV